MKKYNITMNFDLTTKKTYYRLALDHYGGRPCKQLVHDVI